MRYIYSAEEHPDNKDYYFESTKTTNYHFPRIPAHSHDHYEIYVNLVSPIRLKIDDKIYDVLTGDIIVLPPHVMHELLPVNDDYDSICDRMYMYITTPCIKSFDFNHDGLYHLFKLAAENKQYFFHVKNHDEYNKITECMLILYKEKKQDYPEGNMYRRSLLMMMLTLLGKSIRDSMSFTDGAIGNPLLRQVSDYIKEHYEENITLETLATYFYINKQTLSRHFKKQYNISLHDFLLETRLNVAKEKILNGVPPTEASILVGFSDYSTFYRAFQKVEGLSPKEFLQSFSELQ